MIKSKKIKDYIKIILPIIFISYACSILFFTHTHIENGVTIVHSHPYLTDENGNPDHNHSGAVIQLIHNLNTFLVTALIVFSISLGIFRSIETFYRISKTENISKLSFTHTFRLRPPPAL